MKLDRDYFFTHSPIDFTFAQNSKDFVVEEIPLYEWSGEGEHLVLKVRKKNLSTWELLSILSKKMGISRRDIGYAGLKDKNAMTIQYLSIPRKYESKLSFLSDEPKISILETYFHKNKIKIGHLRGNRFFIRLKKVNPTSAEKIDSVLKKISLLGIPNFFGFQRFGIERNNYNLGKEIIDGVSKVRDREKKRLFVNAYQSLLFNNWLSERIRLSRIFENFSGKELEEALKIGNFEIGNIEQISEQEHPFKLLSGDIMMHYPHGRAFETDDENLLESSKRFSERDISPSGLLSGKRVMRSEKDAKSIEDRFAEEIKIADGSRRYSWVFPLNIEGNYREKDFWFELNFYLPKGSYATTLLEEIGKRDISIG
jgi:tRNA pseudouridine13 synthase